MDDELARLKNENKWLREQVAKAIETIGDLNRKAAKAKKTKAAVKKSKPKPTNLP